MKRFFALMARLFFAIAMLFALTATDYVQGASVSALLGRPNLLRARHISTPTPKPSPTATPSPTHTPTPAPTPPPHTPPPTPKPSPSTTPVATPTPTNIGNEITINAPGNNQTLSGTA